MRLQACKEKKHEQLPPTTHYMKIILYVLIQGSMNGYNLATVDSLSTTARIIIMTFYQLK